MEMPVEDGVYLYSGGSWTRIRIVGPFVPDVDGVYLFYFRNSKCPGCKAFDRVWLDFTSSYAPESVSYVLVQCRSFFIECSDEAAADSFIFYLVFETPQVVVVVVENGLPVYVEREAGFIDEATLKDLVLNVRERMAVHREPEEGEGEGEGLYIDLTKRDWKGIVEQLKKLIAEGRAPREVCTEDGCRIVID